MSTEKWEEDSMVLDMRPMLRGETKHIHIDYLLTPDLPDGAQFDGDAHVVGDVTDEAGYMHLELTATVAYRTECARCLEPVSGDFAVQLERTVVAAGTLTEEQLEENVDEYAVIENGKLDLDEQIRHCILLLEKQWEPKNIELNIDLQDVFPPPLGLFCHASLYVL